MSNVKPIPEGYRSVTPYLYIRDAAAAIEYYKNAFGAVVLLSMPDPNGRIEHAELKIGDSIVMLADENPKTGALSPQTIGGTSFGLLLYSENVDAVVQKAVELGANLVRPVKDQFYGDRTGTVLDPFGHSWFIATHVEDVAPEEIEKRAAAAMSQAAGS